MSGPIPLESVNHIARETDDVERSRRFYRDVLGFREVWRPDFDFDGAWLYNYGVMIHIIKGGTSYVSGGNFDARDHVALHTPDIEAVERILKELKIPYKKNYVPKTNVTQVFFHDPDGNHIEVGTYPPVRELES